MEQQTVSVDSEANKGMVSEALMDKNPYEYLSGILEILSSDKKRIGFLFGAGTSCSGKSIPAPFVPSTKELTDIIVDSIKKNKPEFSQPLASVMLEMTNPNIENILDLIEKKIEAVGPGTLNGLSSDKLTILKDVIQANIFDEVSVIDTDTKEEELKRLPHYEFAKWVGQADRKFPIEIFTTNYDYLFEASLEANDIPYYDGFSGSLSPFFNSIAVEDLSFLQSETKLWKIHGSLGWKQNGNKVIRCKSCQKESNKELLIYPSFLKYTNSKKMPFVSLLDRLCNFVVSEDSVLIVLGYSFNDEHINERLITSLKRAKNSHVFAFIYDKKSTEKGDFYELLVDPKFVNLSNQTSRISFIGMNSAIIGGKKYKWTFDPTSQQSHHDFARFVVFNEDKTLKEITLPDFAMFVEFLSSLVDVTPKGENSNG
jgi:hypothetical protein